MKNLPFSMPITKIHDFCLNGNEVMKILSPTSADIWPRRQNQETLIHDGSGRTLYRAGTVEIFAGPGYDDWKQIITNVYDTDGHLIYSTDIKPYLDSSADIYKKRNKKPAYNDGEKIIEQLVKNGNNPEWASKAVAQNIMYVNRVYGKISTKDAAEIIRTIAE